VRIRLELDNETTERLIERAAEERRPVPWQSEVMLRRALGLPFPRREGEEQGEPTTAEARR
jgi:hypothetical protein